MSDFSVQFFVVLTGLVDSGGVVFLDFCYICYHKHCRKTGWIELVQGGARSGSIHAVN